MDEFAFVVAKNEIREISRNSSGLLSSRLEVDDLLEVAVVNLFALQLIQIEGQLEALLDSTLAAALVVEEHEGLLQLII